MLGVLVPVRGGDDIPLSKKEMILGRHESCDVILRFSNVSGKHCKLAMMNGYWYVVDLKSSNGTRINGVRVQDRRIDPGARIAFADHEYFLRYDPVANGTDGYNPPDFYETDVFSHSLLENAGLSSGTPLGQVKMGGKKIITRKEAEEGSLKADYSNLTLDDLKFDR